MPTDAAAKLPEIEHIKARKDGLDVLADIYRYAELGFDAIEPDDLALFRWYGVYTQRAAESADIGRARPIRGDRRPLHAADQVPERHRHRGSAAHDRPALGALRPRDGRHHHPPEHPAALAADRGHAGRPRRAERGRALVHPGLRRRVAKRRRLPARGRRRPRAARLAPADRRARAHVRGRQALLEPAAQVQGVGVGLPAPLRPARDQRHRPGRGRARRRPGLRRLGRRRPGRVRPHGPAAGRVRPARRGGRGVRRDHRDLPRRGQAHQAHAGADQVPGRRVGRRAAARRGRAQDRPQPADVGRPRRSDRPAPRPPGRAPAARGRPVLPGRDDAARPLQRRADDRRRRHRRPLRVGRAALHEPPERDRARRPRRAASRRRPRRSPTSACPRRPPRSGAGSSRAPGWSSASSPSSRRRSAPGS